MVLLEVKHLTLELEVSSGLFRAVEDVSFQIEQGEIVCVVGETGSGKSLTALSIARLIPNPPARYGKCQILIDGQDVVQMSVEDLRAIRGRVVSYVFQEAGASLNPAYQIGNQIKESLRVHDRQEATDAEVGRLLKLVGIADPESRMADYPHQLSGGMQQRAMIAMALAPRPKLLIADEPTSALDATVQAQILEVLSEIKSKLGMSMLLITHNLGIAGDLADRVAVMYAGQIVELVSAKILFKRPLHPYTLALMKCVPRLQGASDRLAAIPGHVPRLGSYPEGCRFHPRCSRARLDCSTKVPELLEVETSHWVRCPYWDVGINSNATA